MSISNREKRYANRDSNRSLNTLSIRMAANAEKEAQQKLSDQDTFITTTEA